MNATKEVKPNRKPTAGKGKPLLYIAKKPMDRSTKKRRKSIKEALRKNPRGLSPGRDSHAQQVTPDHHPATAHKTDQVRGRKKQKKNHSWKRGMLTHSTKQGNCIV